MDGFDAHGKRAIVVGSTNRKSDLDPALLSRFDLVRVGLVCACAKHVVVDSCAQMCTSVLTLLC